MTITSVTDLRKYVEARLKMAQNYGQRGRTGAVLDPYTQGMIYGLEEALKAVKVLEDKQGGGK